MKKISIIVFVVFSLTCCSKVKEIDLNLSKVNSETVFRLDTINTSDWNTLCIVKPYSQVDSIKYDIPESVLRKLKNEVMIEQFCSLLFFKDGQLINYSFVHRYNVADFLELGGVDNCPIYSSTQEYKLTDKRVVIEFEK